MYDQIENSIFYENIYLPIDIIDSVWRSLILNTRIYSEYCFELSGGFIDRVEPKILDERLSKMNQLRTFTNYNQYAFKPYELLWNKDWQSYNEFHFRKFQVCIKSSILNIIIQKVDERLVNCVDSIDINQIIQYSEDLHNFILDQYKDILAQIDEIEYCKYLHYFYISF